MVQAGAEAVLVEQKVKLLEESRVQRKGLVKQGQSMQGSWSSTRACRGHGHRPEHGLEHFICQPHLVDPPGCCIPGLQISVYWLSEEHGGDLTLDVQFESTAEFDHQGPRVRVSGV